MDNRKEAGFEGVSPVDGQRSYAAPMLVRLSLEETESGLVILPIEILTVQGPS